ncbi:kinesin-like protein KIFC3 [Lytechinus pictus]|uniref:kinesin-like protein KIFC3 n=1 Tax=Lytechinus pictus TaxID=7653 RepID=UPI0030B9EFC0
MYHHTSPRGNENMSFKTPKTFHAGVRVTSPTPSRAESMMEELGFDDSDLLSDGDSSDGSYDEADSGVGTGKKAMVSDVDVQALRKELRQTHQQREELLLKVKNFRESSQQFQASYEKEKTNKWQQIKILRKSHEAHMQEKHQLIDSLQDIIRDQENRILELEGGETGGTSTHSQSISSRLEDLIDALGDQQSQVAEAREKQFTAEEALRLMQQNGHGGGGDPHHPSPRDDEDDDHKAVRGKHSNQALESGLRQQLEEANNMIKQMQEEQKQLSGVTDYEKEVEQLKEEMGKLKDDCSRYKKEAQHQEQVRRRESKSLKQSEIEKQQLQKQLTRLQAEMADKMKELDALSAKQSDAVNQSAGMVEDMERMKDEMKKQIRDLESQLREKKSELREKENQIAELEAYKDKAQILEVEVSKLNNELFDSKQSSDTALMASKDGHLKEIKKLQAANKSSAKRIKELEEKLAKKSENLLDSAKKQLQVQESLEKELNVKSSELERVQEEYEELKANPKIVEVEKRVEVESEDAKRALLQFKLQNNKLKKDLSSLKETHADTEKQLEDSKNEVDSIVQKLEEREQEMAEVQQQMEEEMKCLEEAKDEEIQRTKETAEEETSFIFQKYSLMRTRFNQLRPGLLMIAQEYQQLRSMCSQFPLMLSKAIEDTKNEIGAKLSKVAKHNEELHKKYQKELLLRKKYHNELIDLKGNIRVFARVRPLIKEDGGGANAKSVVTFDEDDDGLLNLVNKGRFSTFEVDKVFNMASTQEEVFKEVQPLIISSVDGYNVCIFAYGQTGSGKTFTMQGPSKNPGINQRALKLLFEDTASRSDYSFTITVSVMEIYNEMLRDLLSDDPSNKLDVKMSTEGGLYVPGLKEVEVSSVADINRVFATGHKNRATASTDMNEHSSRSHALLCVNIIGKNKVSGKRTKGKLNLVDLAGSERVNKSGSGTDTQRLKEAQSINKSLSALGDVIQALRAKQGHIPFRNSKLTYLLQESLGGDSKTLMVVQVSPVSKNSGESHCSLSFAQRVRSVELGAASKRTDTAEVAALKDRLSQYEDVPTSASYSTPARSKTPTSKTPRATPRR